jgi:hypothetical protein
MPQLTNCNALGHSERLHATTYRNRKGSAPPSYDEVEIGRVGWLRYREGADPLRPQCCVGQFDIRIWWKDTFEELVFGPGMKGALTVGYNV